MKITIVQGAFLPVPPLLGGAVEKSWFFLGKEFANRGHQVTHISRVYKDLPKDELVDGVRYLRLSGFNAPRSLVILKFFDLIYSIRAKSLLPQADILVTNTFWLPMLVRSQNYGALYVHVGRYPKGQIKFYTHANRLQTVSQAIAHEMIQLVPETKSIVRVIPYPISDENHCLKNPISQKKKIILFVGRVHPEKGVHLLIKAFKRIHQARGNDWKLIIVGPWETKYGGGGERYYAHLRSAVCGVEDKVGWAGLVNDPAVLSSYYSDALLFVYPSVAERGETFGLAVLEAMSHGCVPLVSNLECFKDFIEEGKNGFVFDHRSSDPVASLAEKLTQLTQSEGKLAEAGKYSFEKSKEYRLKHIADLYLSDFEQLTAKK